MRSSANAGTKSAQSSHNRLDFKMAQRRRVPFPKFVIQIVIAILVFPIVEAEEPNRLFLTCPSGPSTGTVRVEAGLSGESRLSNLFLDGTEVCTLTADESGCAMDLGAELHVHVLELFDQAGSAEKNFIDECWINRPGAEGGLSIQLSPTDQENVCGGRLGWKNRTDQAPEEIEFHADGVRWGLSPDRRLFGFPCSEPYQEQVLDVAADFPDGRRVFEGILFDGFGKKEPTRLTAIPIISKGPCEELDLSPMKGVYPAGVRGFEVAFVLSPGFDYRSLANPSWEGNVGSDSAESWQDSWSRASNSLADADRLWLILSDHAERRINGFGTEKEAWLGQLLQLGLGVNERQSRLPESVATAALTVGGSPRRRAVVLLLGESSPSEDTAITPEQARSYLSEIGVPLFVIRSGGGRNDGWSAGTQTTNISALADALDEVRFQLGRQCVLWYHEGDEPPDFSFEMPGVVRIAGRQDASESKSNAVWRKVSRQSTEMSQKPPPGVFVGDPVEVSVVTLLLSIQDENGGSVTDISESDLSISEDGRQVEILDLEKLGSPQRLEPALGTPPQAETAPPRGVPITLFFDAGITGIGGMNSSLVLLKSQAARLTEIGPVRVVVSDQDVQILLQSTGDEDALVRSLDELSKHPQVHAVDAIRRQFIRDVFELESGAPSTMTQQRLENPQLFEAWAMAAATEEHHIITRALERLEKWGLQNGYQEPQILMIVGWRFEEDSKEFYLPIVQAAVPGRPDFWERVRQALDGIFEPTEVEDVGRELAMAGWRVSTFSGTSTAPSAASSANFRGDISARQSPSNQIPRQLTVDLRGAGEDMTAPSGGDLFFGKSGLSEVLEEMYGLYRLTYQTDRPQDGETHELSLSCSRPGVVASVPKYVAGGSSENLAETRLYDLLGRSSGTGELEVTISVQDVRDEHNGHADVDATVSVDFDSIMPLVQRRTTRRLRISFAIQGTNKVPFVSHKIEEADVSETAWLYRARIETPNRPTEVAAVIEDLETGAWGGAAYRFGRTGEAAD